MPLVVATFFNSTSPDQTSLNTLSDFATLDHGRLKTGEKAETPAYSVNIDPFVRDCSE